MVSLRKKERKRSFLPPLFEMLPDFWWEFVCGLGDLRDICLLNL
jgi:hypothetical protein